MTNKKSTLLILTRNQLGDGDSELGQKILGTFLRKAIRLNHLDTIVLFNEGVKLTMKNSPVLSEMTMLEERGVDLMPCGTCLDYYKIEPCFGKVSDMDSILMEIDRADKVISF
ncbi:MAG TPA: DsrE family protein [Planctomycetota bacterium]|jgi:hypothetical protein|nr:hypothetical protein [Planctomycetota bacterium]MDP7246061.1 DsrE family protein [Planctomycetota bacterium]HJM39969.1 DsrE family protein [Planctomycetota bacterium]|tara:strand:- start:1404 stop:1742 length:339 start_codon:yes stop_codon:yes gene_type:complete